MTYEYKITIKWPPQCRSRSVSDMISRPDLLAVISKFRVVVDEIAQMRAKFGAWKSELMFSSGGLTVFFEDKRDVARFAQVMALESEPVKLVETMHDDNSST